MSSTPRSARPPGRARHHGDLRRPRPDALVAAISVLDALSKDQRHTVTDISVSSANLVTLKLGKVTVVWAAPPNLN